MGKERYYSRLYAYGDVMCILVGFPSQEKEGTQGSWRHDARTKGRLAQYGW